MPFCLFSLFLFFFKQKTAYELRIIDWSSDVCSSDLFVAVGLSARALKAYQLSFGASLAAGGINTIFGMLVAWVLVRQDFPGKRIVNALVDLPFALPTAVAGIALTALYAANGWFGGLLAPPGIKEIGRAPVCTPVTTAHL